MARFDHDRVIGHTLKDASPAGTVITEEPLVETAAEPGAGRDAAGPGPVRDGAGRPGDRGCATWPLAVRHFANRATATWPTRNASGAGRDAAGPAPA